MATIVPNSEHGRSDGATAESEIRSQALATWRRRFDPDDRQDVEALRQVAAIAPLVIGAAGARFEQATFGELVEFIAQMPF